jgi:hypothetical protein
MAKRITITGRAETLLNRLVAQFRHDNTELAGTMSEGKSRRLTGGHYFAISGTHAARSLPADGGKKSVKV